MLGVRIVAQYKFDLTLVLEAVNRDEAMQKLGALLAECQWEMGSLEVIEAEPAVQALSSPAMDYAAEPEQQSYVTYRVADETFRVFAKDLGLQGTELKVPKNRDFLQFRIRAFLEGLGYKVEPKTNIRVVAESHVEPVPQEQAPEAGLNSQSVYVKR